MWALLQRRLRRLFGSHDHVSQQASSRSQHFGTAFPAAEFAAESGKIGGDPLLRFIEECERHRPVSLREGPRQVDEAVGHHVDGDVAREDVGRHVGLLRLYETWADTVPDFRRFWKHRDAISDALGCTAAFFTLSALAYALMVLGGGS